MMSPERPAQWVRVLSLFLLISLLAGCTQLSTPQESGNTEAMVETSVAQTLAAQSSAKGGEEITNTPPPTVEEATQVQDTDTPTVPPTMTPTAAPTLTPTPEVVGVHVSANTFCRYGPGRPYQSLGVFNIGEESEIIARDPGDNYWFINNPDAEGECWIWGRYATPEGPTDGFPVYTPPPKPEFVVQYHYLDIAAGSGWIWFKIENTGSLPLDSIRTTVDTKYPDQVTPGVDHNQSATNYGNAFYANTSEAPDSPSVDTVGTGETVLWYSGRLRNPSGYKATLTAKICSEDNLKGICSTQIFVFDLD